VARGRWSPGVIGVLVGTTRGRVVFYPRTRRSTAAISIALIVVAANGDGRPLTVVVPGTVSTGCRESSPFVFIHGWVRPAWGTRPIWVTVGTLFERLDIGNASHARAFEFALVQLLHGVLQVVGGLKLNKPFFLVN
jgi:hypothetical protein